MTKRAPLLLILVVSELFLTRLYAQAPVVSYTPATNVYTVNTAITSLTPTNTGGAVVAGSLGTFAALPGQPFGVSYDPTTGDIITNVYSSGVVYVYSPAGVLLNTYTTAGSGPKDIAVDASGNIYQANIGSNDVVKITPAGVITAITGSPTAMNAPDGMAMDAAGNIYVADQGTNKVYKIAPGATTATVYASGFTNLYGVTVNSSGDVFVSESNPTSNIIKIASGTLTKTTLASGFSDPRNMIMDAAGNIYLADVVANTVWKITPGGTVSTFLSGLNNPRSMVIDPFGDIYIANSGGSDVVEIPTAGYSIDLPLPAGLTFSTTTGVISGTPTATLPTTVYTIAAHNGLGTGYTTETITVNPVGPTGTPDFNCGVGTVNLSASGGLPAGGTYNWYAASSGGASLSTGATYNPSINSTTTFYVDYTQGGVLCAARTAVVGTISADPVISSAPTSGSYFSYGFTGGSTTDLSGSSNTATTHGAPTSTTDRYSASGNALSFVAASSQYISTATSSPTPGPQTFSISAWFKTGTAGGYIVGYGASQTGNSASVDRVLYVGTNGELYFGVAPLTVKKTINTITAYNDGNWHHVVATFSAANGSNMYVDGALAASDPTMNSALSLGIAGYWRVGYDVISTWTSAPATNAATYFNGSLDDIAVANTELTAAQVNVLYGAGSGAFCAGNTLSLTANTVAGSTYSWAGPAGSGYTSTSQNPTVPVANAIAGTYVLTVTNATGCASTIKVTAPGNVITYTWSGAAGTTNPTTAGNWDHLPLFSSTSNLVIPTGLAKYPVLTANESAYNVTLGATASLTLSGFTLSVGCDIINNASTSGDGILYGGNLSSGITWNGSVAAQSYTGTNTTNTASTADMTVNNSAAGTVTINSGPVDIYDVLTLTKGNLVIGASPAALTIKCSATQAGSVAAIPAAYSISGNVTVERYITGGSNYRSYRLISSPVYSATIASTYNVFSLNYLQTGMYLTGSGGGFDKAGNPTIYLYREDLVPSNTTFTSGNFWGVSAINNSPAYNYYMNGGATAYNVPVGNGMMVFFRGNRASASLASETLPSYTTPVTVTLSTTGTLNQGTIVVRNWYTPTFATIGYTGSGTASTTNHAVRGFNLVGNPYASSIDWNNFSNSSAASPIYGSSVGPSVWIFNPHTKNFDTYNANTHVSNGSATNIIPTGQGFFVQATGTSPTLTFNEAAKTSTQVASGNLLMDRRVALKTISQGAYGSYLRLKLITDTVNNGEIVVGFNPTSSTSYNDQEDAKFIKGSGSVQTIASITGDSVNTSVKWLPFPQGSCLSRVIRLLVTGANYGTYTLQRTDFKAIPSLYQVWLMDNYKKDSLDIRANSDYVFDITADTNSYGSNRFSLVIRQNPALMVHLLDFTATKVVNGAQAVWLTENEQDYTNFTVERSTNAGATYTALGGFASSGQGTYDLLDKNPANGANLYRLQMTGLNGTITYSKVVTLMYGNSNSLAKTGISVYPNPAKGMLNLSIAAGFNPVGGSPIAIKNTSASASYNVQITNILGSVIRKATMNQQSWQTDVSNLTPGTYLLQVINKTNNSVVGESTFVKL